MSARFLPRRLGWRLALGFGLLVALLLAALIQASLQIQLMTRMTQRFATQDIQHLLRVQALSLDIEGTGTALLHLMNAPREFRVPEYTQVDERNRRVQRAIEGLSQQMQTADQEQTLMQLKAVQAAYFEAFIAFADQIEAEDLKAARRVFAHQVQPLLADMLTQSSKLIRREVDYIEEQAADAERRFEQMAWWVSAESILAIVLALFLALRTTRSVVLPLAQLETAALRIASGDYGNTMIDTTAEEVNRVGQALGTMTQAIASREQEIERLAFRDPLTGLHNRTFLLQSLVKDLHSSTCLMLIDLARLKTINETLGYVTGDTTIEQVAKRLDNVVDAALKSGLLMNDARGKPVVAHLGGGHFALSFVSATREISEQLRVQIEQAMAQPVHCSGNTVDLSLTYGLADSSDQVDPSATAQLMRNAEVALTAAKKSAAPFAWYSPDQEAARLGHLSLISDLRLAVASSQLQMWLQPKFSLKTGQAVGAEALVRWQHPQRGFVSPAEFVPFAEQTGYIRLVTQWMLSQAVQTLASWASLQPTLSIAVNISTRDLQDPQFCHQVRSLMDAHGINPKCLRMEIVESGLMTDAKSSIAALHTLREFGVQLSIDDFGTGYSSLAYLQQLPVSELKIDRSFVDRVDALPGSQQLVKTMIEMGHGMGLMVTAEGVETQAEKDTLIRLDCDVMQGYFGSKPLHGTALEAWFGALPPA